MATNATDESRWHKAIRVEERFEKNPDRVFLVYVVTKCNGAQLGGAWGSTHVAELPGDAYLCTRCFKEEAK